MSTIYSPFLPHSSTTAPNDVAFLHLRRDQLIPTTLHPPSTAASESTGYEEGHVANTRFGSFPHSTLLNVPWGSQVRASLVDTGRRGRKRQKKNPEEPEVTVQPQGSPAAAAAADGQPHIAQVSSATPSLPRKRSIEETNGPVDSAPSKKRQTEHVSHPPQQASSGFSHILPLTPEAWTISLPHRTQVVYTPDYSFIIQKLGIRPGSTVIEAGGGSGSFMHAAARAVYSGKRQDIPEGRLYTYEYHAPRAEQLKREVHEHGLQHIVTVTHRDVYANGFLIFPPPDSPASNEAPPTTATEPTKHTTSPTANAVFLDLPDPSLALRHLTRTTERSETPRASCLDPSRPVQLSAFLPCIEQVQKFISALRSHGWVEIEMHNLAHRRLEARRERTGLDLEGLRGVNAGPRNVSEAVGRLRQLQERDREFRVLSSERESAQATMQNAQKDGQVAHTSSAQGNISTRLPGESRQTRLERIKREAEGRKDWKEGRLVVRSEAEVKSHTSYLVFAVLPREWTEEDEKAAQERWMKDRTVKNATGTLNR